MRVLTFITCLKWFCKLLLEKQYAHNMWLANHHADKKERAQVLVTLVKQRKTLRFEETESVVISNQEHEGRFIAKQEWFWKTAVIKTVRTKGVVGWKKRRMPLFAKHALVAFQTHFLGILILMKFIYKTILRHAQFQHFSRSLNHQNASSSLFFKCPLDET